MRVLVGCSFGLGNSVLRVPLIKALKAAGHRVEALIGTTPDDVGAWEVLHRLCPLHLDQAPSEVMYDAAVMAIPFDGRWQKGVHFRAKKVLDGRPRPDPSTFGLSSWKKHEVEYSMENARELGYSGPIPDCSFLPSQPVRQKTVYLGVGYKKDAAGFWKVKHWGNERYAALVSLMLDDDPELVVVSTGDAADTQLSLAPINRLVVNPRFRPLAMHPLASSIELVSSCSSYVGNDTGTMHVCAAAGRSVLGVFMMENSKTKSHPWCERWSVVEGHESPPEPEAVFRAYKELTLR